VPVTSPTPGSSQSRPYAYYALGLLTITNLLNYLERSSIFALFEPIKRDLGLTDAHLGWLGSAYVLVFSLASVPAGIIGDLGSRRVVIAAGIIIWSAATSLSGLADGFGTLLLMRSLIGLGGAAAVTAGASMVADYYPGRRRSMAMGLFMAGLAVGGVLGILIAGQLEHHYGWRVAFFVLGLPGFLVAAMVLKLKDPTRPAVPSHQGPDALLATMRELEGAARRILSTPTLVAVFVGGALISFGMNGIVGWSPTFLSRERGLTVAQATLLLGSWGLLAGIVGTVAGGFLGDWLRVRWASGRLLATGLGFLVGSPLAIWLLYIHDMRWFVPVFTAAFFFLTWYNGPLNAVIFDVSPTRIATTVAGAFNMFIHLAGDAIAFPLVGFLSDRFGLQQAVVVLPIAAFIGGVITLLAAPAVARDMERAQSA
jgi:predicted MFS family arabinose efflux permease